METNKDVALGMYTLIERTPERIARIEPNNFIRGNNILAVIERHDIGKIEQNMTIEVGGIIITDYWISPEGQAFFIPIKDMADVDTKSIMIDGKEFKLLEQITPSTKMKEYICSITVQKKILYEGALERFLVGGKSKIFRDDQILTEGFYRLEKAIMDLELLCKTSDDYKRLAKYACTYHI